MKHMVTHAPFQSRNKNRGKRYTCYYCQKHFSRQKFLAEHRKKEHTNEEGHLTCPELKCEKTYASYTDMAKHMHQFHNAGKFFSIMNPKKIYLTVS